MNRIALTAVAAATLLGLAGCSTPATKAPVAADSPAVASQAATAPPATPAPDKKKSALIVKFGETVEYADGIKVTVKHVGTAVGSQYAAPEAARGAEVQLFELTLVNGTADTFEPAIFQDSAVYGAAGIKAQNVFDSGQGVSSGNFTGVMIPGGTQTITAAVLIPTAELSSTVFTVTPSFKHKAAVITGGL